MKAAGQAEVENLDRSVAADHHILGLQVAMDDAPLMRGGHAGGKLPAERQQVVGRQRLFLDHA